MIFIKEKVKDFHPMIFFADIWFLSGDGVEGALKIGWKQSQVTYTYFIRGDTTSCVIPNL